MPSGVVVPVLRPERELPPPEKKDFHCSWGEVHCSSERFFVKFFFFFTCFFVVVSFSFPFVFLSVLFFLVNKHSILQNGSVLFLGKILSCQENITQITAEKGFPGEKNTIE